MGATPPLPPTHNMLQHICGNHICPYMMQALKTAVLRAGHPGELQIPDRWPTSAAAQAADDTVPAAAAAVTGEGRVASVEQLHDVAFNLQRMDWVVGANARPKKDCKTEGVEHGQTYVVTAVSADGVSVKMVTTHGAAATIKVPPEVIVSSWNVYKGKTVQRVRCPASADPRTHMSWRTDCMKASISIGLHRLLHEKETQDVLGKVSYWKTPLKLIVEHPLLKGMLLLTPASQRIAALTRKDDKVASGGVNLGELLPAVTFVINPHVVQPPDDAESKVVPFLPLYWLVPTTDDVAKANMEVYKTSVEFPAVVNGSGEATPLELKIPMMRNSRALRKGDELYRYAPPPPDAAASGSSTAKRQRKA